MTRTLTTATNTLRMLGRRLSAQDGQTLILALSIVTVLMISTTATVEIVRAGQVNSSRERQSSRTLSIGEAGLDKALYTVGLNDPTATQAVGTTIASTSYSFDGGTGTYSGTKNADGRWTVVANATSPNGKVTRRVEETVDPHQSGTAISPVYTYGFVMADPTPDCTAIAGTGNSIGAGASVTVPVYVAGSLCLIGGGAPLIANPATGSKVSLYVGGKFQTSGNSSPVGSSGAANQLTKATVVGGCQVSFHGWLNMICSTQGVPTSGTGSGIWADTYGSTPISLTKPPLGATQADAAYQTAAPGPRNPCGAGSTVGSLRFDSAGSTTRDTSLGTVRLLKITGTTTGNDFDCKFYDASNTLIGRLAYTYGSPGTLTVLGTIFIDGNLSLAGNDTAVYSGSGTIYVNGTVSFSNGARLCGAAMVAGKCSGNWDPSVNSLEIAAVNAGNAATAWDNSGDGEFEGTAFMNGRYVAGNSAWVQGPVIADSGQLSGAAKFKAITAVPPGAPNISTLTANWAVSPGSWRECPANAACPTLP